MKFEYNVPSRISMTLYDMNGGLGRVDGSMGFSLEYPRLRFTAERHESLALENAEILGDELSACVIDQLSSVKESYGFDGIRLTIHEGIPVHQGFGSKTATLLAIGHAYGKLFDHEFDFRELAVIFRRGGTSGLGINLIDYGGFVLEGGHPRAYKKTFEPSSVVKEIHQAPLLARYPMPAWDVIVAVPDAEHIYGKKEVDHFHSCCPIPDEDVEKVARITLSRLLPAVYEEDLTTFCEGIHEIQQRYWKRKEIELHGTKVQELLYLMESLGIRGAGMTSMGPAVYGFGDNLENVLSILQEHREYNFRLLSLTQPNNTGIIIEESP